MSERKTIKLPSEQYEELNEERKRLGMTWAQYIDYLRGEFPDE